TPKHGSKPLSGWRWMERRSIQGGSAFWAVSRQTPDDSRSNRERLPPAKTTIFAGVGVVLPNVARNKPMLSEIFQFFRQCPITMVNNMPRRLRQFLKRSLQEGR